MLLILTLLMKSRLYIQEDIENHEQSSMAETVYRNKENLETIFRAMDKDNSGELAKYVYRVLTSHHWKWLILVAQLLIMNVHCVCILQVKSVCQNLKKHVRFSVGTLALCCLENTSLAWRGTWTRTKMDTLTLQNFLRHFVSWTSLAKN